MLDLQQLAYFVAVAEEEHVGRAAERLSLSPSPLSRQVRALESRIGGTLFDRSGNRLKLTANGRSLLADARQLLKLADQVEQRANDLAAGRAGSLRIGYVEGALHAGLLAPALQRFSEASPGVRLELVLMRSGPQFEALAAGSLDLGVTYAPAPAGTGLVGTAVIDEPFMLAVSDSHRLATGELTLADLRNEPVIAPPQAPSPLDQLAADETGGAASVRFDVAEPTAALAMVAAGLGIAVMQQSVARAGAPGVTFRPYPDPGQRVRIHVCQPQQPGVAAARMAELIVEQALAVQEAPAPGLAGSDALAEPDGGTSTGTR